MNILVTPKSGYLHTDTSPSTGKKMPFKKWYFYSFIGDELGITPISSEKQIKELDATL